MSKNNRSVRPRLRSPEPSPLELACRTGLNRQQIRRLAQALIRCRDLESLLYQLPLRAVEPFLIAALLAGHALPLEKVASVLPRLEDPYSTIRAVSVTTGDRVNALLDLVQSAEMEQFRRVICLYLCVDLLEGQQPPERLIEVLSQTCLAQNSFTCWIFLRDIAVRLEITELLRLTRPGARFLASPMGRLASVRMRHMVFQPPLLGLAETELAPLTDLPVVELASDLRSHDETGWFRPAA